MSDLAISVAVALAGGIGSALRHLVDRAVPATLRERHPWSTTVVNVTGSFALGALAGATLSTGVWHTVLGVGLIGGYTTFSTASLETVQLLAERRWAAAALHGVGLLVGCVAAALAGYALTRA